MMNLMLDICSLGNACIDIIEEVDEAFLERHCLPKGICTYLADGRAAEIDGALRTPVYVPGGCAANTATVVSSLGGRAAFMGRVADDDIGRMFIRSMKDNGILYEPALAPETGRGSTRIYTFITPDAERTFAAYYGEQEALSAGDLNEGAIRTARHIYLDGYAMHSKNNAHTFGTAIDWAHRAGNKIVFNPCDLSVLTQYAGLCSDLMARSNILICNDAEAMMMTGTHNARDAAQALRPRFERGAVTMGADGALAFGPDGIAALPAQKPDKPIIDTNGAGDAFAGGYIYGLSNGMGDERAARLGILCASRIITQIGARPTHPLTDLPAQV